MSGKELLAEAQRTEGQRLSGLFKQQFTFSWVVALAPASRCAQPADRGSCRLALTAAQRTVNSSVKGEALTYIISALTFLIACQMFRCVALGVRAHAGQQCNTVPGVEG